MEHPQQSSHTPPAALPLAGLTEMCLRNPSEPDAPRVLGDYDLFEELGRGGMGVVYRARHRRLDRAAAVKVLPGGEWARAEFAARFRQEAQLAARLRHPHIVTVYETGEDAGTVFYAMELVSGPPLHEGWSATGDWKARAVLMAKVARAVAHAHAEGVLHRDLKPSNILRDAAGEPRVSDFGLACLAERDQSLTLSRDVLGSPAYMAPEQAAGKRGAAGAPADIYALGGVLYFLLTGRAPFIAATLTELLSLSRADPPLPPRRLNASIPRDLETIALHCLEKEPAGRYATALALAEDLERFAAGEPVRARPVSAAVRAWRWCLRRPSIAASSALLIAGSVTAVWRIEHARAAEGASASLARTAAQEASRLAAAAEQNFQTAERRRQELSALLDARDLSQAEEFLRTRRQTDALRLLVESLERNPQQPAAAARLMAALGETPWAGSDGPPALIPDCLAALVPLDNDRLAVLGRDFGFSSVRDMTTLKPLHSLEKATGGMRSWAVDPRGTRAAVAGAGDLVRVWSLTDGKALGTPIPCGPEGLILEWSPDGEWLAIAGRFQSSWSVHEISTGRKFAQLLKESEQIQSLSWSGDGRWLACAGLPHRTELWQMQSSGPLLHAATLPSASRVKFAPGGALLQCGWDGSITLTEVPEARIISRTAPGGSEVHLLSFSSDGRRFAAAHRDGTVRLHHFPSLESAGPAIPHDSKLNEMALSPDGTKLAVASGDYHVRVWDPGSGLPQCQPLTLPAWVPSQSYAIAWRADSQSFLMSGASPTLCRWRLRSAAGEPHHIRHDSPLYTMAITPDGKTIFAGDALGRITAVAAAPLEKKWTGPSSGAILHLLHASPRNASALWAAGNRGAWGTVHDGGPVRIRDFPALADRVGDLAWHPAGEFAAASSIKGEIMVCTAEGQMLWRKPAEPPGIHSLAFAPDGEMLTAGTRDGICRIFKTTNGAEQTPVTYASRIEANTHGIYCDWMPGRMVITGDKGVRYFPWPGDAPGTKPRFVSPCGTHLLVPGSDNSHISTPATGRTLLIISGATPRTSAWDGEGSLFAASPDDKSLRVWDLAAGYPLTGDLKPGGSITGIGFTGARTVVAVTADGVLWSWKIPQPVKVPLQPSWIRLARELAALPPLKDHSGAPAARLDEIYEKP